MSKTPQNSVRLGASGQERKDVQKKRQAEALRRNLQRRKQTALALRSSQRREEGV